MNPELWEAVPRLLAANKYLVLATADADGSPWATPVYFAPDGTRRLLWVSSPDSRHSRNIAARPAVGITVFDSTVPIGGAEALYFEATAVQVPVTRADLDVLNTRLPATKALVPDDFGGEVGLRVYEATIARHYVLVRGGDERFDNVTDARFEVSSPV